MKDVESALIQTHAAIMNMQMALLDVYREKAKYKAYYPIMAEGPAEMILRLRKEIDDLIGLTDYIAEFGVPPTNEELDAMAEARPVPSPRNASAPEPVPAH